jgi:hypothetical protein
MEKGGRVRAESAWFLLCQNNAKSCYDVMSTTPGLFCTFPTGAMYLLLGIDMTHFPLFNTDVDFASGESPPHSLFPPTPTPTLNDTRTTRTQHS